MRGQLVWPPIPGCYFEPEYAFFKFLFQLRGVNREEFVTIRIRDSVRLFVYSSNFSRMNGIISSVGVTGMIPILETPKAD